MNLSIFIYGFQRNLEIWTDNLPPVNLKLLILIIISF